jgi:hypothetical protein
VEGPVGYQCLSGDDYICLPMLAITAQLLLLMEDHVPSLKAVTAYKKHLLSHACQLRISAIISTACCKVHSRRQAQEPLAVTSQMRHNLGTLLHALTCRLG